MTSHLFITEAAAQLKYRAAARRQQALHMIFRAGHQIEIQPLGVAGPHETGFKRHQVDIRDRRLAHAGRFHLQHAAIGKKATNLRHQRCAF